eukprot:1160443-Pelagomonas_calceolata.AAC.5
MEKARVGVVSQPTWMAGAVPLLLLDDGSPPPAPEDLLEGADGGGLLKKGGPVPVEHKSGQLPPLANRDGTHHEICLFLAICRLETVKLCCSRAKDEKNGRWQGSLTER